MFTRSAGILSQGSSPKTILFIVNNSGTPSTDDAAMKTHLETAGYIVTLLAAASTTGSESGYDCVIVSASINSGDVGAKYKSSSMPVVMLEYLLWDEMEFIPGTASNDSGETQWNIIDNTHPITSAFSTGNLTVFTSGENIRYHTSPASGADVLAESPGASGRNALFVFDTGATLDDSSTATNRRVALPLEEANWGAANADCKIIFDNCIKWAIGII